MAHFGFHPGPFGFHLALLVFIGVRPVGWFALVAWKRKGREGRGGVRWKGVRWSVEEKGGGRGEREGGKRGRDGRACGRQGERGASGVVEKGRERGSEGQVAALARAREGREWCRIEVASVEPKGREGGRQGREGGQGLREAGGRESSEAQLVM